MASLGAKTMLMNEYKALDKEKWLHIELKDDSIFRWSVGLIPPNSESYYAGGYFKAEMTFPNNYPYAPPTFKFKNPIYHPNIYSDGKVCISILHPAGDDQMSGEHATERWTPLRNVESVLLSVLLLLDNPEVSSPANVDAGVLYRNDKAAYIRKAAADVERSKQDIPKGFVMPTDFDTAPPEKLLDDDNFWAESDAEDDFGGSDSSGDDEEMADFEEDGDGEQEFDESEEEGGAAGAEEEHDEE